MAERKSVNKYYPPDWDPSKGSVNKYVGQHPLRDRAKKLGQGILVIRFEMPYNIWCGGCNSHIGMGVRYNAEKSKTGMYYTTPIYKFRMKCHLCDNYFEIQTDPKNHDYVILEGARRKEQRWDPKDNEQIETEDKATQKKMATDAMFKLEHGSDDVQKGKKIVSNLASLESRKDEWKDDYTLNQLARKKFREEKKAIRASLDSDDALLTKSSLDIPLLKEREEDVKLAGLFQYRTVHSYEEKQSQKRKEIEGRPLFETNKKRKIDTDKPNNDKLQMIKKQLLSPKEGSSPFDRMTMNKLTGSSGLSKEALGIKRLPLTTEKHMFKKQSDLALKVQKRGVSNLEHSQREDNHDDISECHEAAEDNRLSTDSDRGLFAEADASDTHVVVQSTSNIETNHEVSSELNKTESSISCNRVSAVCESDGVDDTKSTSIIVPSVKVSADGSSEVLVSPSVGSGGSSEVLVSPSVGSGVSSEVLVSPSVGSGGSSEVLVSPSVGSGLGLVSSYSDSDTDSSNG